MKKKIRYTFKHKFNNKWELFPIIFDSYKKAIAKMREYHKDYPILRPFYIHFCGLEE